MRIVRGLLAGWLLLAGGAIAAQTQPAGTAPAVDLSSPKAALGSLYDAMAAGDLETARACMHFTEPRQAEIFDVTFIQTWGPMKLMRALEAKFGEAGKKPFANVAMEKSLDATREHLKTAEFDIEGTTAHVAEKKAAVNPSAENELTGIQLRQDAGKWKVVAGTLADFASDIQPAQMEMMRNLKTAVETATAQTIARLERGEFTSAEQAYADYQAHVREATRRVATTRGRG
jgi:hypothetical protein